MGWGGCTDGYPPVVATQTHLICRSLLTRVLLRENIGGKVFALFENTARAMRFSLQIAEEFCPMFLHWPATRIAPKPYI